MDAERRGAQFVPQRRRHQVLPAVLLHVIEAVVPIQDEFDLIAGGEVLGAIDAVYDPRRRFRDTDRAPRQRTAIGRLAAPTGVKDRIGQEQPVVGAVAYAGGKRLQHRLSVVAEFVHRAMLRGDRRYE